MSIEQATQATQAPEAINTWHVAQRQFDRAAELLHLDPGMRLVLREPQREFKCHFPVKMDDGSVRVFTGYRVHHNIVRGPAKGGLRYHQDVNLDEVKLIGDRTGLELLRTLQDKAVHSGIEVYMEYIVTRLLKDGDRVCGAFGYRRSDGAFQVFGARAVVLATGGAGKGWRINSNSWESTGDGHALGYDAGGDLIDMEFVQFHPTGMVWPPGVIGLLVTEAVRGEGGILRNRDGERFMQRYDPKRMELSTRDVVARAIYTEVKEGRARRTAAYSSTSRTFPRTP